MKKYRIFEKYFLNTIFSVPFWLGCILTTLTCYLTLQFQADYRASAVFEFRMIHDKAQSFLTLIPVYTVRHWFIIGISRIRITKM